MMAAAWFHVGLLAVACVGLIVDHRFITGSPAWLKPLKFDISSVMYLVTLAWIVRDQPRTAILGVTSLLIAVALILENVIIDLQAFRGTTSHFNIGTPLDATLFATMGIGIAVLWLASMVMLIEYWRHPIADIGLDRAIRAGFIISLAGASLGGLMVRPNGEQLATMQRGQSAQRIGAHTVGAPDGGPGLPLTGWSRAHGDLRIAHFLGLHAIQLIPLLLLLARRLRGVDVMRDRRLVLVSSTLYALLIAAVLAQALAGYPLIPAGVA